MATFYSCPGSRIEPGSWDVNMQDVFWLAYNDKDLLVLAGGMNQQAWHSYPFAVRVEMLDYWE